MVNKNNFFKLVINVRPVSEIVKQNLSNITNDKFRAFVDAHKDIFLTRGSNPDFYKSSQRIFYKTENLLI